MKKSADPGRHATIPARDFHLITGGPGSGKTPLIEALAAAGYACSVEAGRGVIQQQVATGGNALPWADAAAFADLMLAWEMQSYRNAQQQPGPVFFDRGLPDVVGYVRLAGLPLPAAVEDAARRMRYNARVFIAPPWQEIFRNDSERKQDYVEAVRTHDVMRQTYTQLGYRLVELPCVPVAERVRFVQRAVAIDAPGSQRGTAVRGKASLL